jgi:hypothetical protein
MTKQDKLLVHLEYVIFEDQPPGTRLNAAQIELLCYAATDEQRHRALRRARVKNPLFLDDEVEVNA